MYTTLSRVPGCPQIESILIGVLLLNPHEATFVKIYASEYNVVGGSLYKRELSTPLLKFLGKEEATYTILEVHGGIIGQHL